MDNFQNSASTFGFLTYVLRV